MFGMHKMLSDIKRKKTDGIKIRYGYVRENFHGATPPEPSPC